MIAVIDKIPLSFDKFIDWYPENSQSSYEGSPKQPTFTVCTLIDGEYEIQQFRGGDRIISPTCSELELTVDQICMSDLT